VAWQTCHVHDAVDDDPLIDRLVVVPTARARGVGRMVARLTRDDGVFARVFFYDDGTWGVFERALVVACPPGVWAKEPA